MCFSVSDDDRAYMFRAEVSCDQEDQNTIFALVEDRHHFVPYLPENKGRTFFFKTHDVNASVRLYI